MNETELRKIYEGAMARAYRVYYHAANEAEMVRDEVIEQAWLAYRKAGGKGRREFGL